MDFLFKNFESAQAQAKLAALNAQKTAKGFAEQVSKQGKNLAEHVQVNTQLLAEQVHPWSFSPCSIKTPCSILDLLSGWSSAVLRLMNGAWPKGF